MSIDVAEALLNAQQRLITVLDAELADELDDLETPAYPLPEPEHYIESIAEWPDIYRKVNVGEVSCLVDTNGATSTVQDYTGDSTQREKAQKSPFLAMILFREAGGFDAPQIRGRRMTSQEWLRRRAEKYKGALLKTIFRHANDGQTIHHLELDAYDADVQDEGEFGVIATAGVMVEVYQEVLIPTA